MKISITAKPSKVDKSWENKYVFFNGHALGVLGRKVKGATDIFIFISKSHLVDDFCGKEFLSPKTAKAFFSKLTHSPEVEKYVEKV